MDPIVLVQRKLGQDEKCLMCVIGRLIDGVAKLDRYLAIVEKYEDHGIFILSSKRVPAFSSDDLIVEEVLSVDGNLRAVQETVQSEDPSLGTNLVVSLRTNIKKIHVELPNDKWSLQFVAELKRCQDVESQNAAFGLPSSFSWLDKYRSHLGTTTTTTNPFANDVFDPLKYMNIENTQGETVVDNMPGKPVVEQKFSDDFSDSLSLDDIKVKGTMKKSASRDSLDILETNNENGLTDSVGKITEQLGIAGSGVDLGEQLKPASARENLVRFFMTEREDEFTYKQNLRVFCGTWNVNGQSPGVSIREWLAVDPSPPDVYAIGFQELDLSNQAYIFSDSPKENEWQNAVRTSLHPKAKYKKVKLIRLVGVMLIVYVKEEHAAHVKFIDTDSVATGILGIMGNKGGVGVRMTIRSTSLLFINSHLAAHQEEYERRNQDYRDIDSKMRFKQFVPPLRIDEHDLVFWIGDLNYRIADLDIDKVKAMIDKENFHDLVQYDQLHRQLGRTEVFKGYSEGKINFKPTYKFDAGTDNWDTSEKSRIPAWCDRILFKGTDIKQLQYRNHMQLKNSDHKPVSGLFDVPIKIVDAKKSKMVYEDIMKKLDRLENDYLPQVKLDKTEFVFKDVKFIEPQDQVMSIINTGQVPVTFEFIQKLDESSYCRPWMKVEPCKAVVTPGNSCEIQIEVYVDKNSVSKLNCQEEKLEDILVLHLIGGKDFFITVSGNYVVSSFGSSIEALVQMHGPIKEVPTAQLVEIEQPGSLGRRDLSSSDGRLYAVPKEIWRLVDHIWQYGRHQENLFQQPGLNKEIQHIRDCLDSGVPETLPGSVHSVCEALLLFLECLPEPVLPSSVYKRCLECSGDYALCKQILSQIPECHKNVFRYLCAFLRELLMHAQHNDLEVKFLASIFGEVVLQPPPQNWKIPRSQARDEERKRADFVQHFLLHQYDE